MSKSWHGKRYVINALVKLPVANQSNPACYYTGAKILYMKLDGHHTSIGSRTRAVGGLQIKLHSKSPRW